MAVRDCFEGGRRTHPFSSEQQPVLEVNSVVANRSAQTERASLQPADQSGEKPRLPRAHVVGRAMERTRRLWRQNWTNPNATVPGNTISAAR